MDLLAAYGWNSDFAQHLGEDGCVPARVVSQQRGRYWAVSASGELPVELSGRIRFQAAVPRQLPAVGDWLAVRLSADRGMVIRILPRKSVIARGSAGRTTQEQILAANVDTAFIVTSVDRDFNLRRMERYLSMIWSGGVRPVILLNKVDLCPDHSGRMAQCCLAFPGVGIHALSALHDYGLDSVHAYLQSARTAVMLGSSGVGKSTLLNRLVGRDLQRLGDVRAADQRGRHTTSSRQMFLLSSGGLLIDTPGLRELSLWNAAPGLSRTFGDIEALSARCRFRDCRHRDEPECAVLEALHGELLNRSHYDNYIKLLKEQDYQRRRDDPTTNAKTKRRWKSMTKDLRLIQKFKRGEE
jgi:ribosome biogenesis GTPase / thiamine phosphate phosphatase